MTTTTRTGGTTLAKKLSFDAIPGVYGKINHDTDMEIILHGDQLEAVRKYLTAYNLSASYQLSLAEKRQSFDHQSEEKRQAEIADLKQKLVREYFGERPDGTISVPIGFWYLCEQIEGHLNTEIPVDCIPDWLRPYQKEDIIKALRYRRATICAATGLGKTIEILAITYAAVSVGKRVCIIEPTIDLVNQTLKSCAERNIKACGAGGNHFYKPGTPVLVSTLNSAYKYIDVFDVILVDENHHASASTWFNLLASAFNATHVYGFSATPYRTDGMDLGIHSWCGPVVVERPASWGIEHGWLTKPDVYSVQVTGLPFVSSKSFAAVAYNKLAHHAKVQTFLMQRIKKGLEAGRTIMVIFNTVKAGQAFQKKCKGILDFEVAHADYRKPFIDYKEGKTNLLVGNVKLFGEGVDVPRTDCIITLCNNDSEIITRQVIGRAMRIAKGKKEAIILDVWFDNYEPYVRARKHRVETYLTIVDKVKEICI